jgi:LAS superfamily LD-carboxypeptidase LdcB
MGILRLLTGMFFSLFLIASCEQRVGVPGGKAVFTANPTGMDTFRLAAEKPGLKNDPDLVQYLTGRFDPAKDERFVPVGKPYSNKENMLLRREAFEAFKKMWKAAKKDGVSLNIISSTRNFDRQKSIWEGKWERFSEETPEPRKRALKILEYSSMPGSSRHHWGTDIDLNDLENPAFEKGGQYEKTYNWLQKHAQEYGFCQPYTPKGADRPNGYNEEKWHWSYMPLARPFPAQYKNLVANEMIGGFKGSETAPDIDIVGNYVLGINNDCK